MDAAKRLRGLLHEAFVLEHFKDTSDHIFAKFLVRVFPSAELQCQLDLRSIAKELPDLAQLVFQVAGIGAGMELDFLDLRYLLSLAGLLGLYGLLIPKLAVVHDLADWRNGIGRNLDKIQPLLVGHTLRLACRHDTDHLSIGIQDAHLLGANLEVDTSKLGDKAPLFYDFNSL